MSQWERTTRAIIEKVYDRVNYARTTGLVLTAAKLADELRLDDLDQRTVVSRTLGQLAKRGILRDLTPERVRHHQYQVLRRVPNRVLEGATGPLTPPGKALEAPLEPDRPPADPGVPPGSLDALVGSLARKADLSELSHAFDYSRVLGQMQEQIAHIDRMVTYIYTELAGPVRK